jgi:hypothetical protein
MTRGDVYLDIRVSACIRSAISRQTWSSMFDLRRVRCMRGAANLCAASVRLTASMTYPLLGGAIEEAVRASDLE